MTDLITGRTKTSTQAQPDKDAVRRTEERIRFLGEVFAKRRKELQDASKTVPVSATKRSTSGRIKKIA
jgi:hypothetical protein